jgi:hypothetical protein
VGDLLEVKSLSNATLHTCLFIHTRLSVSHWLMCLVLSGFPFIFYFFSAIDIGNHLKHDMTASVKWM